MSAPQKSKPSARSPRAFKIAADIADSPGSPASGKKGKSGAAPTGTKTKRKPRTVKPDMKMRPVDDLTAQRMPATAGELEKIAEQLETSPARPGRRNWFSWGRILIASLLALGSLGFGLWVDQLITTLFDRNDWLGWVATGLVGLIALALVALISREMWGQSRMAKIDGLRHTAETIRNTNDTKQARKLVLDLENLYSGKPEIKNNRKHSVQY